MAREWLTNDPIEVPAALRQAVGGHPLVARLLAERGISDPAQARAYLDPTYYTPASPWALSGMESAVRLLREAIARRRYLRIWGDFDADGQTSTAVLYETLIEAGAWVDYQLPRRDEGHGLHFRAVDDAVRDGVSLLITCDTGISEIDAVAYGVERGLTMIVTDHHDLHAGMPPAQAVVNPKLLPDEHPLHELSGVGVAYMVARALFEGAPKQAFLDSLLDLLALGLVADMAVQVQDVRYWIQRGLPALRATERPGLRALACAAGLDLAHVDEGHISFQIGPRLNAAGRLADSILAVRLLTTRDAEEANALAHELEGLNRDRQARTAAVQASVAELLRAQPEVLTQPLLILEGEQWEPGVLGLVAGDLAHRYDRPVVLISHRGGQPSVGSARSVAGIDVHEAIARQRALLLREGGHPMAAGFSLEREQVPAFRAGLLEWLGRVTPQREPLPPLTVDAEVVWHEINLGLAYEVERLAPFGAGNPPPVLATRGGTLASVQDVSSYRETPHRRLFLYNDTGRQLVFTWFHAQALPPIGQRIDLAFRMSVNYWRGQDRLELELLDWRPTPVLPVEPVARPEVRRKVVDWRHDTVALDTLLARLHTLHGEDLLIWAEDLPKREGTLTRHELTGRQAKALAVLTPPPDPEVLRRVLAEVQPQVVYLLPMPVLPDPSPDEFLGHVRGMLRVALHAHGGWIDAERMAARVGARATAIIMALRGLDAAGKIVLRYEGKGLRAYLPAEAPPEPMPEGADAESEAERLARRRLAEEQARNALAYLLRETRAYRQAYASQPLETLGL